jgi:flagellar basal-body rod protein FlgC
MSSFRVFDIAGSALSAQSLRLNTVASNLANADAVGSDPNSVYKAPADRRYEPGHPLADADGYVFAPNVNPVEEMVNLISASRAYQGNVEVLNTAKELALRTLTLGS